MNKKRDVLFLSQYFYPEYVTSAILPYDIAVALRESGFTVDVMCGYPWEYIQAKEVPRKEIKNNIKIKRIKYIQMSRRKKIGRFINTFSFTLMSLLRLSGMSKYNIVIVFSNPPILPLVTVLANKLFNTKIIFVAHDLYPEIAIRTGHLKQNNMISRFMNYINIQVYRRVSYVVVLSKEMKKFVVENRFTTDNKVIVIPNWHKNMINTDKQKKDNRYSREFNNKFVVSYFGNMGICQDMDTILEAVELCEEYDHIQFFFAGHGSKLEQMRESVQNANLTNVKIVDFLCGDAFTEALAISDCGVVSLYDDLSELCTPSKTYSYMMAGLALVAITNDNSEIVRDICSGAGVKIKNGDAEELARTIQKISSDPAALKRMSKKSRKLYLEKYTPDVNVNKYVNIVRSCLQG